MPKLAQVASRIGIEFDMPMWLRGHEPGSALLAEFVFQLLEAYPFAAARKPSRGKIMIFNVLDMLEDRLAGIKALGAAGFPGQGVQPSLDFRG
jgi:hypothetical protein